MFNDKNTNDNTDPKKDKSLESEEEASINEVDSVEADNGEPKKRKNMSAILNKRSFKFGSMATAFTAIFIVIVILVNVAISVLSQSFPLSLDLTSTKNFDIGADTIKYIAKIKQPITIKIFATATQYEADPNFVAPLKIMQQYHKYNSNINVEFIDYDKNPTAVAAYSKESLQLGDIVVSTIGPDKKEHYKYISFNDLLVTQSDSSTGSTSVVGNKTEQTIDAAIDYVTSTVHPTLLFTSGHDEADASAYQNLLKNAGYNISSVNIVSDKIPQSASALVLVSPKVDFSSSEIAKIDKFLKNGGKFGKNIFIYCNPNVGPLPNLDEYISEWGVQVGKGVIYDNSKSYDYDPYSPISYSLDSSVVGNNISAGVGTDVEASLPLTTLFTTKGSLAVTSVIQTEDTSKLLANVKVRTSSNDKSGPFTTMTLSTLSSDSSSVTAKSHMIVSGSYLMLGDDILNSSEKNNAKVLLGVANNVMSKNAVMNIDSKYDESTSLSLTTAQRNIIMVIFVAIIPLAILIFGIVMWLRRRHL